jgi:hypothetical protein
VGAGGVGVVVDGEIDGSIKLMLKIFLINYPQINVGMCMDEKKLYKYRKFDEYTEQIISNGIIYVPSPLEFNDPFDCRIPVLIEGNENDFRQFLFQYFKNEYPEALFDQINQLTEKQLAEGKHKNRLYMNERMKKAIRSQLIKTGVYCMSGKNDDILMWSHYADSHKGYCIEFEGNEVISFLNKAKKVTYQKKLPVLNFFDSTWLNKALLTKSNCWEYEEEWRIISVEGPGLYELPNGVIASVILGCQMPENHKNKIISIVTNSKKKIQLYQAIKKEFEFGLDIKLIYDKK